MIHLVEMSMDNHTDDKHINTNKSHIAIQAAPEKQ
jgi:hypothetical protein